MTDPHARRRVLFVPCSECRQGQVDRVSTERIVGPGGACTCGSTSPFPDARRIGSAVSTLRGLAVAGGDAGRDGRLSLAPDTQQVGDPVLLG